MKKKINILLLIVAFVGTMGGITAQNQTIWTNIKAADNVLVDLPVMCSAIHDGVIVNQQEGLLVKAPSTTGIGLVLAPGVYDVRIEGDGIITEVKKGVQLFADRNLNLSAVVRPGQGVHIVEYAIGSLAREEVAMRLQQLESSVKELQNALQKE